MYPKIDALKLPNGDSTKVSGWAVCEELNITRGPPSDPPARRRASHMLVAVVLSQPAKRPFHATVPKVLDADVWGDVWGDRADEGAVKEGKIVTDSVDEENSFKGASVVPFKNSFSLKNMLLEEEEEVVLIG